MAFCEALGEVRVFDDAGGPACDRGEERSSAKGLSSLDLRGYGGQGLREARDHEIQEGTALEGLDALRLVDEVDGDRLGRGGAQEGGDAAFGDGGGGLVGHQAGDAEAGGGGIEGGVGRVDGEAGADRDRAGGGDAADGPAAMVLQAFEGDAVVVGQGFGGGGFAAAGEVGGSGADDPADLADLAGDQVAVGQAADADGDVHVSFDEVDHLVGEDEADGDFGVGGEEGVDDGRHVEFAEHDGGGDEELAAGGAVFAAGGAFGVGEVFDEAAGGGDEGFAGFGEDELAGGADEELGAEMGFEV